MINKSIRQSASNRFNVNPQAQRNAFDAWLKSMPISASGNHSVTFTITTSAENLLAVFAEARKLDAPVDMMATTLLENGLERWLSCPDSPDNN